MAVPRINIEEDWFIDPRRINLIEKIGAQITDGLALQMWRLAQQFHRVEMLIPFDLYEHVPHSQAFLDAGLAEKRESGYYIKGKDKHFHWLTERSEAGKNKMAKINKTRQANVAKQAMTRAHIKRTSNTHQSDIKHTSSSSSFLSEKNKYLVAGATGSGSSGKGKREPKESTSLFWFYESELLRVRGIEAAPRSAKLTKQCKDLVDAHGLEKAKRLVQAYLLDGSDYVKSSAWMLGLLISMQQKYLAAIAPPVQEAVVEPTPWDECLPLEKKNA